jgi:hypothetical protein
LYSIISAGYNYTENFWTAGAGLGTSVKLVGNLSLNFELTSASLYNKHLSNLRQWNTFCQFRPVLNYRFAKHFKMYVGPSLNLLVQKAWRRIDGTSYIVKVPYSIYNRTHNDTTLDMWIGVVGGLKF